MFESFKTLESHVSHDLKNLLKSKKKKMYYYYRLKNNFANIANISLKIYASFFKYETK